MLARQITDLTPVWSCGCTLSWVVGSTAVTASRVEAGADITAHAHTVGCAGGGRVNVPVMGPGGGGIDVIHPEEPAPDLHLLALHLPEGGGKRQGVETVITGLPSEFNMRIAC